MASYLVKLGGEYVSVSAKSISAALALVDVNDGDEVEVYTLRSAVPYRFLVNDVTRREIKPID